MKIRSRIPLIKFSHRSLKRADQFQKFQCRTLLDTKRNWQKLIVYLGLMSPMNASIVNDFPTVRKNMYLQSPTIAYVLSWARLSLFRTFDLAISKPVNIEKSYMPQKKALLPIVWKKFWNWKNFCHGRLQTSSSKSSAFSNKVY